TPAAPMKVYVVGDSTGVVFAGGLALYAGQTGKVDVRSGAYRACPMTDVDEFKWYMLTGLDELPVESDCFAARSQWAADFAGWRPDMILVISGPADVSPGHPVGAPSDEWLVPTEPAGRRLLEQGITSTSSVLQSLAPGVPQLWLTSPYILREQEVRGVAYDPDGPQVPAYTDVYNQILTQLSATHPLVAAVPWADYFNAKPISADSDERPDGVHIPPERVAQILAEWFPKLAATRASLLAPPRS
ncbi:MAG: SGNH/GDSL hydrolase family protein, partial [Acidimicrobiia bacterium]